MKQWQIKCVQEKKGHQKKPQTRRLKVFEIFPKVLCNFFFNLSLPLTPSPTKVLKSYNMAEFGEKKKTTDFFFFAIFSQKSQSSQNYLSTFTLLSKAFSFFQENCPDASSLHLFMISLLFAFVLYHTDNQGELAQPSCERVHHEV